MSLAEEFFNIAQQADNQKKLEQKIKQENENKILKENTLTYWNTYLIPLIKQRAEDGIYFTNLKIAEKFDNCGHYFIHGQYFPVEPVDTVYGGVISYKSCWDRSDWRHYEKYWKLPISINELLTIIKENGFYIKEGNNEHDEVYNFEFSCKPHIPNLLENHYY